MEIPSFDALGVELAGLRDTLGKLKALLEQADTLSMLRSSPWTCDGFVGHLSHYATLASNASGLIPPRYAWRRWVL